jgi:hypothetical protein
MRRPDAIAQVCVRMCSLTNVFSNTASGSGQAGVC